MTDWEDSDLLCYGDNLGFLTETGLLWDRCSARGVGFN